MAINYAQYLPQPERLATLGELAQARDQREATRQAREINQINLESKRREFAEKDRAAQVQEQLRQIFARNTGPDGTPNQKAILREAYGVDPSAAQDLEKHFSDVQKAATAQRTQELEGEGKRLSYLSQLLQGVDDEETYQLALPAIRAYDQKYGDNVAAQLGPAYDAKRVGAAVNAGLSQAEYRQRQADVLKSTDDNVAKALNLFSLATDEAGWQDAQAFAKLHAVDDDVATMGLRGGFSPEMAQKAGQLAQTPQQRATLEKGASGLGSDYGRFEADFLESEAAKLGKTVAQLNPQERVKIKTAARKQFGQADDAAYRGLAPIVIQTAQGPQILDRTTGTTRTIADPTGKTLGLAPTADMRNKEAGRKLVANSINAIKTLSDKIITRVGPSQRADAIKRGVDTVFGNDPEFRTYQDARMALAGNLAVGQQGSRPSDADIKAIWLPLVPDPYRDTKESADMKWALINTMSNNTSAVSAPGKTVTETQLKNIANMRKTDIETERKRAAEAGYQVVP